MIAKKNCKIEPGVQLVGMKGLQREQRWKFYMQIHLNCNRGESEKVVENDYVFCQHSFHSQFQSDVIQKKHLFY